MTITSISRDWGVDPSIVRIVTTDNLFTVTSVGYLASQETAIEALQNGAFTWTSTDSVLISASDGQSFFKIDPATSAFVGQQVGLSTIQYVKVPMTASQFLGMYAAPFLIVPAGGLNTVIQVKQVLYEVEYGGAQFANGGVVNLQLRNTANGAGTPVSGTVAANVFTAFVADGLVGADGTFASATAANSVNQGLYLSNATAAFTAGTSTVDVHVWYSIVKTTF